MGSRLGATNLACFMYSTSVLHTKGTVCSLLSYAQSLAECLRTSLQCLLALFPVLCPLRQSLFSTCFTLWFLACITVSHAACSRKYGQPAPTCSLYLSITTEQPPPGLKRCCHVKYHRETRSSSTSDEQLIEQEQDRTQPFASASRFSGVHPK